MRNRWHRGATLAAGLFFSVSAFAAKANPADFPLRVHIFQFNSYSHYWRPGGVLSSLEEVDGEGRANLYQNGQPRGFDFSYDCSARIMVSPGYETYVGRWKKPERELEILLPVLGGNPGDVRSCDLQVTLKQNTVYVRRHGLLGEEPIADFKAWMTKYNYDPERGLNQPGKASPGTPGRDASAAHP